jgi:ABC-type xylose transport system substrate-binding protein
MIFFFKCAFSHVALEEQNCGVNKHAKIMSDEAGELKNLLRKNKEQFESKNKSLTDERKKIEDHKTSI